MAPGKSSAKFHRAQSASENQPSTAQSPDIMPEVAVYDTRPYDREYLQRAPGSQAVRWHFLEFRLNTETAPTAQNVQAVCVFVNDRVDRPCLEQLASLGVKLVALRCAGFNNVDLPAAKDLSLSVVRVPAYSPHAVAEHAIALLLTLNRKITAPTTASANSISPSTASWAGDLRQNRRHYRHWPHRPHSRPNLPRLRSHRARL